MLLERGHILSNFPCLSMEGHILSNFSLYFFFNTYLLTSKYILQLFIILVLFFCYLFVLFLCYESKALRGLDPAFSSLPHPKCLLEWLVLL